MDNVNIDSVGGNSNLQDWASEETLQLLLRVTLENKKLTIKQANAATETLKLLKKVHKQSSKPGATNNSTADTTKQTAAKKKQTEATEKNTKETEANTKSTSLASSAMGMLAFAAGSLVKLFTDSYSTYNNLIKYGNIVQDDFNGMSGSIGDLGVLMKSSGASLDSLEKSIVTSSRAIRMYGTKTFAETIGQVSEQLYKFGFTNSESAEYIAKDLESRRRAGLINNVTNVQYQAGLMQGTNNLMKFSKVLGESWEKLQQDSSAAIDVNDSFQLWLRKFAKGSKEYENAYQSAQNVAMAFGPEFGKMIADMVALDPGAIGADPLYKSLVTAGGQEIADLMVDVANKIRTGSLNTEDSLGYLAGVAKKVSAMGVNNQEMFQIIKTMFGNDIAIKIANGLAQLNDTVDATANGNLNRIKAENDYQAKLKKLQSSYEKIFNSFRGAWLDGLSKIFESDKTQKLLNNLFGKISDFFASGTFQKLIDGLLTGFTSLVEKIAGGINYLFEVNKETGQTHLADMADSVKAFMTEKFPTMVDELTNMARSIMSFINDIRQGGLSNALFGVSQGSPSASADVTKVYPFTYDSDKLSDIREDVNADAEKRKLLKEAEKIWSDPLYKEILNEKRFLPSALNKPGDRDIVELARDNIKQLNKQKIPNISMIPGSAFDQKYSSKEAMNKNAQLVANAPRLLESYNAKNPAVENNNKKQAEEIAKVAAENTTASQSTAESITKDTAAVNDDKLQGLVYALDTLTSDLQNLILVPDLLASINNVLTSIKNGQNAKLV